MMLAMFCWSFGQGLTSGSSDPVTRGGCPWAHGWGLSNGQRSKV